jgi:hypothetical protein
MESQNLWMNPFTDPTRQIGEQSLLTSVYHRSPIIGDPYLVQTCPRYPAQIEGGAYSAPPRLVTTNTHVGIGRRTVINCVKTPDRGFDATHVCGEFVWSTDMGQKVYISEMARIYVEVYMNQ